ncbi:MAG: hypothetical protein IJ907_02335 [Prevotella sp.]|nr:hypothetical protein [Prevotella sp.]
MKKEGKMTQKEAVKKALEELGGRARLGDIYPRVIPFVKYKPGSDISATLRRLLQTSPEMFRRVEGKKGWWELVSYQEELATLKKENEELKERNNVLMTIPKEAEFIEKFLAEVMNEYKRKRPDADPIRNILRHMGHEEAAAVLDAWIDEKEDELAKALLKLAEKPTYKYERGAIHLDKKQEIQLDEEEDNKKKR